MRNLVLVNREQLTQVYGGRSEVIGNLIHSFGTCIGVIARLIYLRKYPDVDFRRNRLEDSNIPLWL